MSRGEATLRPATAEDSDRLRAWRNDPETVAMSNGQTVAQAEHGAWLEAKLGDPDARLWIIDRDGSPVGQVRVERLEGGVAELHIAVAADARGQGVGRAAIEAALRELPAAWQTTVVVARVRRGNRASLAAFERAGFAEQSADEDWVSLSRAP